MLQTEKEAEKERKLKEAEVRRARGAWSGQGVFGADKGCLELSLVVGAANVLSRRLPPAGLHSSIASASAALWLQPCRPPAGDENRPQRCRLSSK